ncbi:hypothetical protein U9M48_018279 [Paspalum notatum var. saurae]|uniref:Uncharacterized protein n=1 Tax=Paspalum notatum var. saurae TaxID=547442 RepID=A0AAQ3WQ63_PASNO
MAAASPPHRRLVSLTAAAFSKIHHRQECLLLSRAGGGVPRRRLVSLTAAAASKIRHHFPHRRLLLSHLPDGAAATVSPSTGSVATMDRRLLDAATSGDTSPIMVTQPDLRDPGVLLATTPQGNTCLHIASALGHLEFCKQVLELNQSLLTAVNADNETPLVIAVKNGHASLASVLLGFCRGHQERRDAVLQKDQNGCNALHHAIRGGHRGLALELIAADPGLSRDVNKESPMFIAAVKNFEDVVGKLLEISDSSHGGPSGQNALHAAVGKGNPDIVRSIMMARPWLAREENGDKDSPMRKAVCEGKIDIVAVLLQHDRSLGYLIASNNSPLLNYAAAYGHVGVARELLKHCPDAPYCSKSGFSCLHAAAWNGRTEFVQFVLGSKHLQQVINMQEKDGRTALHLAAEKRNSRLISALLLHQGIDITLLNNKGKTARQVLAAATKDNADSIWVCMLSW